MWAIPTLFLIISFVNFDDAFVIMCPECNKSLCKEVACGLGQVSKADHCNCCNECVTVLKEGDECGEFSFLLPPPPQIDCADDLVCFEGKCQNKNDVIGKIKLLNKEA